jgi:hypothetical protein
VTSRIPILMTVNGHQFAPNQGAAANLGLLVISLHQRSPGGGEFLSLSGPTSGYLPRSESEVWMIAGATTTRANYRTLRKPHVCVLIPNSTMFA